MFVAKLPSNLCTLPVQLIHSCSYPPMRFESFALSGEAVILMCAFIKMRHFKSLLGNQETISRIVLIVGRHTDDKMILLQTSLWKCLLENIESGIYGPLNATTSCITVAPDACSAFYLRRSETLHQIHQENMKLPLPPAQCSVDLLRGSPKALYHNLPNGIAQRWRGGGGQYYTPRRFDVSMFSCYNSHDILA